MPKYEIQATYTETRLMRDTVFIDAPNEQAAIALARQIDERGEMDYRDYDFDCDTAVFRVIDAITSDEDSAMSAMAAAYLGE
jgi:hypothetical protein